MLLQKIGWRYLVLSAQRYKVGRLGAAIEGNLPMGECLNHQGDTQRYYIIVCVRFLWRLVRGNRSDYWWVEAREPVTKAMLIIQLHPGLKMTLCGGSGNGLGRPRVNITVQKVLNVASRLIDMPLTRHEEALNTSRATLYRIMRPTAPCSLGT